MSTEVHKPPMPVAGGIDGGYLPIKDATGQTIAWKNNAANAYNPPKSWDSKPTLAQRLRNWLRRWLGIDYEVANLHGAIAKMIMEAEIRLEARINAVVILANEVRFSTENKLITALQQVDAVRESLPGAMEEIRKELLDRLEDLTKELTKKRPADSPDKQAEEVHAGHVPFTQRRREAQGRGTNMAAYVQPGKGEKK